jgi:Uma2 family endonuclease
VTRTPVLERGIPWTEQDYFALGETPAHVELFDGTLLISPCATPRHQRTAANLAGCLDTAARQSGTQVHRAVNVRLRPGRIAIPDVVVAHPVDLDALVVEARDITLICEITSTNVATDRVLKMHYYATAGIPWYLLVDPKPLSLSLYRLDGDKYVEEASAAPGERLLLTAPITTELDPASLGD